MKKFKLWVKALWLYVWYKPHYEEVERETSYLEDDLSRTFEKYKEGRWYVKKRFISWAIAGIVLIPLFMIVSAVKAIWDYFVFVLNYYESWFEADKRKKNIKFIEKLDIVLSLHRL